MKKIKQLKKFRPAVRSRHPSHSILRTGLALQNNRTLIRLGSSYNGEYTEKAEVEINSVKAIETSSDKLFMKQAFEKNKVQTAIWFIISADFKNIISNTGKTLEIENIKFPILAKSRKGSRNRGNTLIHTRDEFASFLARNRNITNYIFEKFYNYSREYRLHVTKEGCFYTCRKMLKNDVSKENRWYRNDSNCVWILEDNPKFNKPKNWEEIEAECVKALNSVGLDIGACDVKTSVEDICKFIIIEINSAPSFGELTGKLYIEQLNKLISIKLNK